MWNFGMPYKVRIEFYILFQIVVLQLILKHFLFPVHMKCHTFPRINFYLIEPVLVLIVLSYIILFTRFITSFGS